MRVRLLLLSLIAVSTATVCGAQAAPARLKVSVAGHGDYRTVQEAVEHATGPTVIAIEPGVYREKVEIERDGIWLVGMGAKPEDVVITFGESAKTAGSTFKSGTVSVESDGFAAENLSIVNTWWDEHADPADASQAVALQLSSDKAVVDRVRMVSGQDTLYANSRTCRNVTDNSACAASRQYFDNCYVEGNVDYIFGDAKAVFQACELHSRPHHAVMITAQSKHFPAEDSGYYFLDCRITGANDGDHVALGRPWRDYATVLFYHTDMQQTVAAEGWSEWGGRLKTANYREYDSFGPGVNGGNRAVTSPALSSEEKKKLNAHALLGESDAWDPAAEVKELRGLAHARK